MWPQICFKDLDIEYLAIISKLFNFGDFRVLENNSLPFERNTKGKFALRLNFFSFRYGIFNSFKAIQIIKDFILILLWTFCVVSRLLWRQKQYIHLEMLTCFRLSFFVYVYDCTTVYDTTYDKKLNKIFQYSIWPFFFEFLKVSINFQFLRYMFDFRIKTVPCFISKCTGLSVLSSLQTGKLVIRLQHVQFRLGRSKTASCWFSKNSIQFSCSKVCRIYLLINFTTLRFAA